MIVKIAQWTQLSHREWGNNCLGWWQVENCSKFPNSTYDKLELICCLTIAISVVATGSKADRIVIRRHQRPSMISLKEIIPNCESKLKSGTSSPTSNTSIIIDRDGSSQTHIFSKQNFLRAWCAYCCAVDRKFAQHFKCYSRIW